jgi:SAM-dependent methyltransferase
LLGYQFVSSLVEEKVISSLSLFGKALMDYYEGNIAPIRICRDDGFVYEQDLKKYFSKYHDWPEYERKALEHINDPVLDVGCGAGRHSLWIQSRGFEVTAIDASQSAIEVAKHRGVRDCKVMNIRDIDFPKRVFGSILLIGTQFGVGGSLEATKRIMNKFREILKDDGSIIATSNDISRLNNKMHIKDSGHQKALGKEIEKVKLRMEYKTELGDWFQVLLATPKKMKEICLESGLTVKQIYRSKKTAYSSVLKKAKSDSFFINH